MTEQEIINNYLLKNPSKDNGKKSWYKQCKCCSGKVTASRMKPATIYSGLESKYADPIHDFPKNVEEDLCNLCLSKIRNANADLSNEEHISLMFKNVNDKEFDPADTYTDNLDKEVLKTEQEYQGWESFDKMEGTGFSIK